jgi:hypothetical protein
MKSFPLTCGVFFDRLALGTKRSNIVSTASTLRLRATHTEADTDARFSSSIIPT